MLCNFAWWVLLWQLWGEFGSLFLQLSNDFYFGSYFAFVFYGVSFAVVVMGDVVAVKSGTFIFKFVC